MSYAATKNRVVQWLGIILIIGVFAGAYYYFQVYAGVKTNVSPTGALTSGLVGYWTFDGADTTSTTTTDRSGNSNTGTLTGGPTVTPGKLGQALNFDGTNYVSAADSAALSPTATLSVSFWANRTDSLISNNRVYVAKSESSARSWGVVSQATGAVRFYVASGGADSSSNYITTDSTPITQNNWFHVVAVFDGSGSTGTDRAKIYVNGSLQVSTVTGTINTSLTDTTSDLKIGYGGAGNYGSQFRGNIDEVRIYNRPLSAAEIQSLYKSGQSDEVNTSASQPQGTGRLDSGLAGYWKMDDGSGTSATDASTNGNTGTLTNGPTWTTGQIGGAVDFDGTDDYVATSVTLTSAAAITVSAWVKGDAAVDGMPIIGHINGQQGSDNQCLFYDNAGTDSLSFGSGGAIRVSATLGNGVLGTTNWHFVTYTNSGTTNRIFLDGALVGENASGALTTANENTITIGQCVGTATTYFNGKIDDARIYNRALSADEVAQLYRLNAPTSVDTGLKGYWSFNGKDVSGTTAYDRSGAGNTGTLTNGPTVSQGVLGQALSFDGTDDDVRVSDATALDITGTLTLSAWIKKTSHPSAGGYNSVLIKGTAAAVQVNYGLQTYGSGGSEQVAFYYYNGGGQSIRGDTNIDLNQWYFVTAVYDDAANSIKLYVNGVLQTNTVLAGSPEAGSLLANNLSVYMGSYGGASQHFPGRIDEPRVYNRALSAAEIQSLYKAGQSDEVNTGASQPQGTGRLDSGLAGYWKLDDGSGTSATDSSTNANTGTLTNGPTWGTGQIGGAVTFDGTDDYITAASSTSSVNITGPLTVSVWIKPQTTTTSSYVVSKWNGGVLLGYLLQVSSNATTATFFTGDGNSNNGASATIVPGAWNHVVGIWDGTNTKIYVNGVFVSNATSPLAPDASGTSLIFSFQTGLSSYYKGDLDEARVYNRALSTGEVAQLYRLNAPTGVDTSLKGYWSFNGKDMSGTTAYDRSGSGSNGSLGGGTTPIQGKVGQALAFASSHMAVSMTQTGKTYTFSVWTKITSGGGYFFDTEFGRLVLDFGENAPSARSLSFYDGTWKSIGSANSIPLNEWVHLVWVFDNSNSTAYGYINGALRGTSAYVGTNIGGSTCIGDYFACGGSGSMSGALDELRIYNRALTEAEVKSLYNASK